ncbi:hypothetical protein [Nocardia sp. A7]|uniref:hypothetical protein n=1 Tax=Nocardia sp. A7 TaxID=2789274 RepID=UPI00397C82D3
MKRSLAAVTLAGALMVAPMATANAQLSAPAPAKAAATLAESVALPADFNPFHALLELLHTGSSILSGGSKVS